MRSKYLNNNRDPREITVKYECQCAETGKTIRAGEQAVYYPIDKRMYHIDSNTAYQFRNWKADLAMGYDY